MQRSAAKCQVSVLYTTRWRSLVLRAEQPEHSQLDGIPQHTACVETPPCQARRGRGRGRPCWHGGTREASGEEKPFQPEKCLRTAQRWRENSGQLEVLRNITFPLQIARLARKQNSRGDIHKVNLLFPLIMSPPHTRGISGWCKSAFEWGLRLQPP